MSLYLIMTQVDLTYISGNEEIMKEVSKREKEAGIVPDIDIDTFMKATSIEGQKRTLQTDYILKFLLKMRLWIASRFKIGFVAKIRQMGSMCYMSGSIQMENVYVPENEAGMWQWLFGKSVTSMVLLNTSSSDGFVGIAAPSLARILPIDLAMFGGELLRQPDAFLCSINDVKVTNTVDQRAHNVIAGAEGFLRQKLSGQGLAFIVAGGSGRQSSDGHSYRTGHCLYSKFALPPAFSTHC